MQSRPLIAANRVETAVIQEQRDGRLFTDDFAFSTTKILIASRSANVEISLIDAAANGFLNILQLKVFLAMLVGVSIGTFTAVAPQGLGIPLVYAIMLPVVIKWEPLTGIALLIGASSVSAIIWGLFEYTLEIRWPPGLLFGY